MSAEYDRAYAETLMHIDGNYGYVRDGNGDVVVGRVESELYPRPQDPGFRPITAEYLAATIASKMPDLVQKS